MAKPYNHATEELKFKKKKDAENETCRNNGMKEDAIHEKDKYDRKDFNSARRNAENSAILSKDFNFENIPAPARSPLTNVQNIDEFTDALTQTISPLETALEAYQNRVRMLVFYIHLGFSESEAAKKIGISPSTASKDLKSLYTAYLWAKKQTDEDN